MNMQRLKNKKLSILAMLFSISALAGYSQSDKLIYDSLNVEELIINPGALGTVLTEKSIGGLTCEKSQVMRRNSEASYTCSLEEVHDAQAIYNALAVIEARVNPASLGANRIQKTIGNLVCLKSRIMRPGSTEQFSCVLQ